MTKKISERLIWADIVRILAIYFVVLVHSMSASAKNIFPFSSAIASTCVPLFIMLSGALLLDKKESYSFFYKKRFLRLLLPWLTWTGIYFTINYFQNPVSNFSGILSLFSTTLTSFWFLPMIAALYIITPALRIFTTNAKAKDIFFLVFLWFVSISVLPYYKNSLAFPFYVDDGIVRQVFTYLGYYLLGAMLIKIKLPKVRVLILGLIFGFSLTLINYYFRVINNLPLAFFSFNFVFPGVVISSTFLFLILKSLDKKLNSLNTKIKLLIFSLSTASFGIYFLHGLITDWLLKINSRTFFIKAAYFGEWINSLLLFIVSYLIIWGLTKIPYLKKFIT